jgi:2-hydroxy-6-oxonona-2,4-dienedioate hydrolase
MVPTARRLADEFCVYAPDLPGFGYSTKPRHALTLPELAEVLAGWMNTNGLVSAAMVGNSFGCQVIAEFGLRYPQGLRAAILQGPTIDATDRTSLGQLWRFLADLPREQLPEYAVNTHDYWRAGLPRLIETFRIALADRIEDKLPRLQMPMLIVRGVQDPIVSEPWARRLAQLASNGTFVATRGAHTPNFSQPDAFTNVVRWFLRRSLGGAAET